MWSNENGRGCTVSNWRLGNEKVATSMPRVWKLSPPEVCNMCQTSTCSVAPPLLTTADAGQ